MIWMLGDVTNLFGCWKQNLLPTMIGLELYYTLCDLVILLQIFYYRRRSASTVTSDGRRVPSVPQTESDPLLGARPDQPKLNPSNSNPTTTWKSHLFAYLSAYVVICVIGVSCWLISEGRLALRDPTTSPPHVEDPIELWDTTAQVVGWISAAAYLGSRVPQIFKNQQTKCKGLSMLFFMVCLLSPHLISYSSCSATPVHPRFLSTLRLASLVT